MPFAIQRVQTNRGSEFFGVPFQETLKEQRIKFRPNRPAAPHLKEKVERSQQTDKVEFWPTVDHSKPLEELKEEISLWQMHYNWHRPHGALDEKAPVDRWNELKEQTPLRQQVEDAYDEAHLPWRIRDYRIDLLLNKLKRSP